MSRDKVTRDDWIVGGLALLLMIDLLLFPWYSVTVGAGSFTVSESFTAIQAPYAWPAVLAVLVLLALLVDLGVHQWAPGTNVPAIGGGRGPTRFALAILAAVLLAIKFLLHIANFGVGFILAVILAAALIYASLQRSRGVSAIPGRRG